ncbi:MAG: hypothetical protein IKP20_04865 [Candidatus Methanomethylophilaceae archaeon]|nr:hypothetical protein [Candidatus Methanomethylophilaceae archaeon]
MSVTSVQGHPSAVPRVPLSDVLKALSEIKRRTDKSGCWPFETEELIKRLVSGDMSISDPSLQAILLDWMESEDYNEFVNLDTGTLSTPSRPRGGTSSMPPGRRRRGMR